ncbi:MAG: nucleotidyltransferase family protein [Actinomycetota bacterium]|nr:nucleotidyltransferase family protein [Actinomycetota bacterium]MDQ3721226.1 nucleotidyltransferase family protein [Actinomycetota bacterium]
MGPLDPTPEELEATLKRSVAALEAAGIPYLLGGSLASWARGGPQTRNDLDLMILPGDAERALKVLEEAGMRPEKPPEEWLFKAWDGNVLVDLIFGPVGLPLGEEVFQRGERLRVLGMNVQVMSIEDVMTTKLLAIDEHAIRYESLLEIARALREQIDWPAVRARTAHSPFSRPFFLLLEELEILGERRAGGNTVRVVGAGER